MRYLYDGVGGGSSRAMCTGKERAKYMYSYIPVNKREKEERERERRGSIDARMKESTEHFGREAEIDAIGNRGNDAADSMFGVRGIFGARGGPSITLPNHHFFRAFLSRAASNEYIMYKRYTSILSFCLPQLRLNSLFALVVIATALSSPLPS